MADLDMIQAYMANLASVLPPLSPENRLGEAARPSAPFDIDQLNALLLQSQGLSDVLLRELQESADEFERSKAEVRLMGLAAADLAVAEQLLGSDDTIITRASVGDDNYIRLAIESPEKLLRAPELKIYRATDGAQQTLLAATNDCLKEVRKQAATATSDAIGNLFAMDLAVLKEAADMISSDIAKRVRQTVAKQLQLALDYVLSASDKIRNALGPENEALVRQKALELIEKLRSEDAMESGIEKFLHTDELWAEARTWIKAYDGSDAHLEAAAKHIASLQGSFAGRMKIADVVVKGMSIVKLIPVLNTPPWGPIAVAAVYIMLVGYVLYSAYDHVDSDRYPFLDRVQGVRGTLISELNPTLA